MFVCIVGVLNSYLLSGACGSERLTMSHSCYCAFNNSPNLAVRLCDPAFLLFVCCDSGTCAVRSYGKSIKGFLLSCVTIVPPLLSL